MPNTPKVILLVEDSKPEAYLLTQIIKRFQPRANIDILNYGKEVIPYLENSKNRLPDFVILDLILPDIDGVEILQSLKTNTKFSKIPVLVRSGLGSNDQAEECYQLGANWFFEKTGDLELLEKQIKQLLERVFK